MGVHRMRPLADLKLDRAGHAKEVDDLVHLRSNDARGDHQERPGRPALSSAVPGIVPATT